jgi:NAD(P)-dependent dehydrogenase (short-subunit alcohol dehydrogenase family)
MLATAGLGATYAMRGVRVVGVSLGLTDTGRVAEGLAADARLANIGVEGARRRNVERIPIGRRPRRARSPTRFCFSRLRRRATSPV